MSGTFKSLIKENIAPYGKNTLNFTKNGATAYRLHIPPHMKAPTGNPLYTFGAISDVHCYGVSSYSGDTTANEDYARALQYLRDHCDFTVICGDMTCYGTNNGDLDKWLEITNANKGSMPVYGMCGNHEWWGSSMTDAIMQQYTGHNIWYSFTHGNDVFIMCGMASSDYVFTDASIQWLQSTLEANRNKRCFLFCHGQINGYAGDPTSIYPFNILGNTHGATFISLLQHYKNTIYFHGHSHILYSSQTFTQNSNPQVPNCIIDTHLGIYSVHIPSLAIPIDITSGSRVVKADQSQGYVIDVFENKVVLKGRNFVTGKFEGTAWYCLDTTLKDIPANSFGG